MADFNIQFQVDAAIHEMGKRIDAEMDKIREICNDPEKFFQPLTNGRIQVSANESLNKGDVVRVGADGKLSRVKGFSIGWQHQPLPKFSDKIVAREVERLGYYGQQVRDVQQRYVMLDSFGLDDQLTTAVPENSHSHLNWFHDWHPPMVLAGRELKEVNERHRLALRAGVARAEADRRRCAPSVWCQNDESDEP